MRSRHVKEPIVDTIYSDACNADYRAVEVGPTPDDLTAAVIDQPGPAASGPVEITVDGHPGKRVHRVIQPDLDACRYGHFESLQIW